MNIRGFGVLLLTVFAGVQALAQFPEDALRLAAPGIGVGARALGMGNAYTGVASDYSAIFWNPAGLAQARYGEFSVGMSYQRFTDKSSFFRNASSYSVSSTALNNLGVVYPVPVARGSFSVGFGYHRQNDFSSGVSFSGFNPGASYVQTWAPDGQFYPSDLSGNLAYQLFLANIDTVSGRFVSAIKNRTTQISTVLEGGGLDNWAAAAAVEVAQDVLAGANVTYVSGSYKYDRNYIEEDRDRIYETFPFDFRSLTVDEFIKGDVSGWFAKFGLLLRLPPSVRLGITVKTPTAYGIREEFGTSARSTFDNGDAQPTDGPFRTDGSARYDVTTPWVFGAGASVAVGPLLLSGDAEFTDWSTLEFSNADPSILDLNRDIREIFRPAANFRLGSELDLRKVRPRAGFMYNRSPYVGDPPSFDQKFVTAGLGIQLGTSAMLDVAYAYGWWDTFRINDFNTSRTDESIVTHNVLLTTVFRF